MIAQIFAKKSLRFVAYNKDEDKFFETVPKGNLKRKIVVGDFVEGVIKDNKLFIEKIIDRKNSLFRPKVANINQLFLIFTYKEPDLNLFNLDRLLAIYHHLKIDVTIVFNKLDLLNDLELQELNNITSYYNKIGYKVIKLSAYNSTKEITQKLQNGLNLFAGQSGVGKSTIINSITGNDIFTQEISHKIKRGKNSTIDSSLYKLNNNIFIGDTPGFSEIYAHLIMNKEQLKESFIEFNNYSCRFDNCIHINEPDCGVKENVINNNILQSRYDSYVTIYNNIKAEERW